MFVLDGMRNVRTEEIEIPRFHLGHLGFVPGLEVYCRSGSTDDHGRQEFTLTPFQGHGHDLFLFKCVFQEARGVVVKALSAFALLRINVVSMETATINGGKNHVLYCILSWSTSEYKTPVPIDDDARSKFASLLPLLPVADSRYLVLLEALFLFCRETLDHEEVVGQNWLPHIQMRSFDSLDGSDGLWEPMKVDVKRVAKARATKAFVDLSNSRSDDGEAILLSETETKTLRVIFPGKNRAGRFLHIAFHHVSRPGALLAIAKLLSELGFNILTSLLRKVSRDDNVWEVMLEFVGDPKAFDGRILPKRAGVEQFRAWAFGKQNMRRGQIATLASYMRSYRVQVSRPSYPRHGGDGEEQFEKLDVFPDSASTPLFQAQSMEISQAEFREELDKLRVMRATSPTWGWLADLFYKDICRRCGCIIVAESPVQPAPRPIKVRPYNGTVFVSLPAACREHLAILKEQLTQELNLDVETYIDPDSDDIAEGALRKIRNAEFFFALWHPDKNRPDNVSAWMPFEYGSARTLGKKRMMIFHSDLPADVKRRLEPSRAWIEYSDLSFREKLRDAVGICREQWVSQGWKDLSISIGREKPANES